MSRLCIVLILVYRFAISPLKPPSCRFYPTCSEYGLRAFERHGFWRGGWYTIKRILKCHPFYPGGFDDVPMKKKEESTRRSFFV